MFYKSFTSIKPVNNLGKFGRRFSGQCVYNISDMLFGCYGESGSYGVN
jgi:hypothetical protein